ncbi:hypothetical protein PCCS19_20890 [Paenibacillus sp. CCS19]|uniref:hypothetical protein n=1 Tax=Paenibacillus sp. CCS19 TaxID=3158387 RepID=UPI0025666709|nr:hypothetical protein [Paenibacillus cellulosilyticus]GMK39035.1 hypothetical protein PCCS19_20890 [Paenibacillus cellulosilyticus]
MKKPLAIATLTLASALAASAVSAADPQPQASPTAIQSTASPAPDESLKTVPMQLTTDNTSRTVTDGIHLDVAHSNQAYIPEFTLELWSVHDNKLISSAAGNSENYDKQKGVYHLVFNHPEGFKLDDQLAFILRKADSNIQYIKFRSEKPNENRQFTINDLKVNTSYSFLIDSFTYFEGEEGSEMLISDLTATSLHPIKASLQTDSKKVGLMLQTESGSPLKKAPVEIKLSNNKGTLKLTSGDDGMVWIDRDKLTWKFLISSPGKVVNGSSKAEVELPQAVVTGEQKETITIPVVFQNEPATQHSEVKLNLSPVGNTDLSTSWTQVDVTLTSSEGVASTFTIDPSNSTISGLPNGTYKVAVTSEYSVASIESDSLTIKDGSATLDIKLKPKYTLEIDKDGAPFNFSVINVESIADKKYEGKDVIAFGVTPGQSFMVKDNETGKIDTVVIDPSSPRTKVVLGAGIVFGGSATAPHTGDSIVRDVFLFTASLIGAAVTFVLYRGRKKKNES